MQTPYHPDTLTEKELMTKPLGVNKARSDFPYLDDLTLKRQFV